MTILTIGLDYTSALHQTAGIGRYTRELVTALTRLRPHQYRLFAADAHHLSRPALGPNFGWHPSRLSERWLARLWHRLQLPLPVEWWTGPLELFHAPDFFLPPTRCPAIVTIHDLSYLREPDSVMPGMTRALTEWVPRAVARADRVIAVSEATRQDLIELYATPPAKIKVIYHGVNPGLSQPLPAARLAAVRQKYGLDSSPFLLSVGTLHPRKNYGRLVEALALLPPDLHLAIVGGRGWDYETLFETVARLNLSERVHFLNFVPDDDLPALYQAAHLFVYPSLYEGFGLPLLEAMACGTPVIAANRSAMPEVVGQAGLLVDPTDPTALAGAIEQLHTDPEQRHHLATAAQQRAARFTWQATAESVLALYDETVGGT